MLTTVCSLTCTNQCRYLNIIEPFTVKVPSYKEIMSKTLFCKSKEFQAPNSFTETVTMVISCLRSIPLPKQLRKKMCFSFFSLILPLFEGPRSNFRILKFRKFSMPVPKRNTLPFLRVHQVKLLFLISELESSK